MKKGWLLLAAAVAASFLSATGASADTVDPKRIFAQSEPGTVLMIADFEAHVTVPSQTINEGPLRAELINEVTTGQLAADEGSLFLRALQLVAAQPDTYILAANPPRQVKASFEATGSGFVIDPSGYIVTNAHVAAPHDDEIKKQLAKVGLDNLIKEDLKSLEEAQASGGFTIPDQLQKQLLDADANWLAEHLTVTDLQKKFSAALGANIPGVTTDLKLLQGDVVAAGDPIPGKDVAILKVEQSNLPTVPLGDDTKLQPGDKLFVLGYPGAATFHPLISKESVSEPSFTSGQLSARKTATGGYTVLQTDAAVTHGNSGGPVFDSNGVVVGIATFGSLQQGNETELAGFNFIMPASLIRQFVDRSGAHPSQGLFSKLYSKGLDQEAGSHYKDALKTFNEINAISPGHPYVQQHISQDQGAIASGKDKGGGGSSAVPIVIVVLVLLVLGGAGFVLFQRRQGGAPGGPASSVPVGASVGATAGAGYDTGASPGAASATSGPPTEEIVAPAPSTPAGPEEAAAPSYCRNCGANLEGRPFCGACGAPAH